MEKTLRFNTVIYIILFIGTFISSYQGFKVEIQNDSVLRLINVLFCIAFVMYGLGCYSHYKYRQYYKIMIRLKKHPLNKDFYGNISFDEYCELSTLKRGRINCLLKEISKSIYQSKFYLKWELRFVLTAGFFFFLWNVTK
jgi:hypothetical protein